jgi:DNA-binding IscR family transcriptional regulator
MAECNDDAPCGMHDNWKALRNRIMEYLERTTIQDLADGFEQKRENLIQIAGKPKRCGMKTA